MLVIGYDGAELVDIACVTSAFALANRLGAAPHYRVELASLGGRSITSDSGLRLEPQRSLEEVDSAETMIVSGGLGHVDAAANRDFLREIVRLAATAGRIASVCTGTTVLAQAGLLDGRRATTHWFYATGLAARYPAVTVDASPIYVRDGNVSTSGGVTASLDLTLSFIEDDHGVELARRVAVGMVTYLQRPGNQAQMSIFTSTAQPDDATVRRVIEYIIAHPEADLHTESLAAMAGVSPRQLHRLFTERQSETPGSAVRRIRLEIAARLAATTDLPVAQIARRCGFRSAESLRQAFVLRYGISPREFRRTHLQAAH
ncbi:Transcriptional regulator GlxA family, contains an amidase domain and an AraC-type DNA-binding HTH domain [Microlunatus soli]|uniref:Transcriptional regulator GlxA family, contains an amidase domain and an AraC-type DNA-binding HTH domain n=1 Tax=Microlunatus soli TaxID=630515 RepID=A0A1H1PZB8_9ACTN|nr:Transcriptional regulator GlxA family, contains an amidase domain and an AraC-type DNA-binding HTH domain [Microlunatus soli]